MQQGLNNIRIYLPETGNFEKVFAAFRINGQFDKEKLEFFRISEKHKLLSDFSWKCKKGKVNSDITQLDDSWKNAGKSSFLVFKPQMYGLENSEAIDIWYPEIDTNRVTSVYFAKIINIPTKTFSAKATYLAQKKASIWINGEKIVSNEEFVYDVKLNKAQSYDININNLKIGENVILVRVTSDVKYKGFIFDMTFVTEKYPQDYGMMSTDISDSNTEIVDNTISEQVQEELIPPQDDAVSEVVDKVSNFVDSVKTVIDSTRVNSESEIIESDSENNLKSAVENESTDKELESLSEGVSETIEENSSEPLKRRYILSDYTWFSTDQDDIIPLEEINDDWQLVSKSRVKFFADDFEEMTKNGALGISYLFTGNKDEDGVAYYFKNISFDTVPQNVVIKLLNHHNIEIWVNNKKLTETEKKKNSRPEIT